MATSRRIYQARISTRMSGDLRAGDLRQAQRRAMRMFAPIIQEAMRRTARERVKNSPSVTNRGRRRYPRTMAESYTANLIAGERQISLTANTMRGRIFELGAKAHPIYARPGRLLWFRHPKPRGPLHARHMVEHPGQRANPVMGDTLRALAPVGERLLDIEIERAL